MAKFETIATGITNDLTPLPRPKAIENMQFLITSNISDAYGEVSPATDSTIYLGNFAQLVMGVRLDPMIKVLEIDTFASNLLIEIMVIARVDFLTLQPKAFCTLTGITNS